MQHIRNLINGMLIGISSIIPGMSGGTMSVILDIFDEMIGAISNLRRNFKKSVIYLAPIGVGMVLGVLLLSGILSGMLQSHPVEMQLFFIGVVAGSIPLVVRKSLEEPFRRHSLLALIAALAVMICIFFVRPDDSGVELIRNPSLTQMIQLLLYAAFAAAAMVIPGVSGSFFLMLFGVYHSVLTAVSEWNFAVLVPTGVGMIIGILFCAKILDILLQQHKQAMYFGILGCVIGSIPNIWPSQPVEGMDILWGLLACLAGAALSLLCTSNLLRGLFSRRKPEEK
ncbi:MAG TPA: DUF368 domain-containing protein [Candidatus Faecivivens stercorigallinarum]|nr:DUF368 domain-containing protein [Candidatus Faecivivens stercorigallinarum]